MKPDKSSQLILLNEQDNVLTCRRKVHKGDTLLIDGVSITAHDDIDVGHKLARADLETGDVVVKYGVPVGSITRQTRVGEHVHMHNMKSNYIASHTRQSTGEEANS